MNSNFSIIKIFSIEKFERYYTYFFLILALVGHLGCSNSITIMGAAPAGLSYSPSTNVYVKGTSISSITPSSSGGIVASYAVSPSLPSGLSMNTSTGAVSGTPTAVVASAIYTVTATNTSGSTTQALTLTVNDAAPKSLSYSSSPATYEINAAISTNTPSNSGGTAVSYSVSPSLPTGLSLNTSTGKITGTPTATQSATSYTITATNTGGSTTASLSITVIAGVAISPSSLVATASNTLSYGFAASGGLAPYTYSIVSDSNSPTIGSAIGSSSGIYNPPNKPGTTQLIVTDALGCTSTATVNNSINFVDGIIRTSLETNGSLYLGGNFSAFQPYIANRMLNLDLSTGAILTGSCNFLSGFDGAVNSMVVNGTSIYVGGIFLHYNGQTANYLAKINLTNCQLDTTFTGSTGTNAMVAKLAISGTSLYLGGNFTTYQGATANYLAKVDLTSGALDTTFTQSTGLNNNVVGMIIYGSSIYVGGQFNSYQGTTIGNLAKLDLNSGSLDTTFTQTTGPNNTVQGLAVSGSSLYLTGSFTTYRGSTANYLAKVDLTSGALDTTFTQATGLSAAGTSLAVSGTSLYVGGVFTTYRGANANYLAKVDQTSGNLDTAFTQATGTNGNVYFIAASSTSLYVGGQYTTYRGSTAHSLAKVDLSSGVLDTTFTQSTGIGQWNISLGGVNAITVGTSSLYVGGAFTSYRGTAVSYLAKVNYATGLLDTTFTQYPGPSAYVRSMATSGTSLYIGGDFTTYRGTTANNLAKLDLTSGVLDTTFTQATGGNGTIRAMLATGGSLYIGGAFTTYRGSTANYLAKVDLTSGALDTTFTQATGASTTVKSMVTSGSSLYIGGDFTTYRGSTANYLAKVDLTSGNLDTTFTQATGPSSTVWGMTVSGSSLYLGGAFTTYRGSTANYLGKVDLTSGNLDTTFTGATGTNNIVYCLTTYGSFLYFGGNYTTYQGTTAGLIAKVSLTSGALDTSFTASPGIYVGTDGNQAVYSIAVSAAGTLYVGGAFTFYRALPASNMTTVDLTSGSLVY